MNRTRNSGAKWYAIIVVVALIGFVATLAVSLTWNKQLADTAQLKLLAGLEAGSPIINLGSGLYHVPGRDEDCMKLVTQFVETNKQVSLIMSYMPGRLSESPEIRDYPKASVIARSLAVTSGCVVLFREK
jgi:hypothetical protein